MATASSKTVDLETFKSDMKALGYGVRVRTNSEFKVASVSNADGEKINSGNVLTSEHIERHQAFYDYKNSHSVRDGSWVVVI